MLKKYANSGEKALILAKLRQGMTAPAIAHEMGFSLAVICDIRNDALETGALKYEEVSVYAEDKNE